MSVAPFSISPEGYTFITPGDRSPKGEETGGKPSPTRPAPGGRNNRTEIISKALFLSCSSDLKQLPLQWRPPGAGLGAVPTPGCVALRAPHPGLCLSRPSGWGGCWYGLEFAGTSGQMQLSKAGSTPSGKYTSKTKTVPVQLHRGSVI